MGGRILLFELGFYAQFSYHKSSALYYRYHSRNNFCSNFIQNDNSYCQIWGLRAEYSILCGKVDIKTSQETKTIKAVRVYRPKIVWVCSQQKNKGNNLIKYVHHNILHDFIFTGISYKYYKYWNHLSKKLEKSITLFPFHPPW